MTPRSTSPSWLGLILLGVGCAGGADPEPFDEQGAVDALAQSAGPVTTEPETNYKSERKRIALLGLNYEGDTVQVVSGDRAAALQGYEGQTAADLMARSQAHLQTGDRIAALTTATRAVLQAPDVASGYLQLAEALTHNKMTDKALVAYATAAELEPGDAAIRYAVGDFQWRNGLRAEARVTLAEALALDPDLLDAHQRMASIHFFQREDSQAWQAVHAVERLGGSVPPQLRQMLAARTPEPTRSNR